MLHFNSECPHNGSRVGALRMMFADKKFADMLLEVARLGKLELSPSEELIVRGHQLLAEIELGRVEDFRMLDARFLDLATRATELVELLGDEGGETVLEIQATHAYYADKAGASDVHARIMDDLFRSNTDQFYGLVQFLIVNGLCAYRRGNLGQALGFFVAAWTLLQPSDRLCLREIAARFVAKIHWERGQFEDAREILTEADLPVTDHIEELLVVPFI